MVSRRFKEAVKAASKPQYELAWEAGLNPATLSQIMTGYSRPKPGDPRVLKVAALLGLDPGECFEVPQGGDAHAA